MKMRYVRVLYSAIIMLFLFAGTVLAQPVTVIRDLPDSYEYGERVEYTLTINVDENSPPVALIIIETLPAGWSNPSSTPEFKKEENGEMRWLFSDFDNNLKDTTITIWADATCGAAAFSGKVNYDDIDENVTEDSVVGDTLTSGECPCVPTGADNNCNGVDEDCDGTADDDYPATPTTCGKGVCASAGQITCLNAKIVDTCEQGQVTGNDADCNGIDENCSGAADENYHATPTTCGKGVCA